MNSPFIQIDRLKLRVTGLTRDQGRKLGEAVARRLAASRIAGQTPKTIPSATLIIRSGTSASVEALANEIVSNVNSKLVNR